MVPSFYATAPAKPGLRDTVGARRSRGGRWRSLATLMPRARLSQDWLSLPDEALLDVRMSDLPLAIEGPLAERVAQLRDEMAAKGLRCPIHFYLADEWFTPDGATAIAIPFYL